MKTLSEYLINALEHTKLLEMAISRSEFVSKANSLRPQIFQNWCLVQYAKQFNDKNLEHWKRELKTHLLNLEKFELKSSNRKEILEKEWIKKLECHKLKRVVYADIWAKLEDEDIDDDWIDDICLRLNKEVPKLIELIGCDDTLMIRNYIKLL